jgi:hypothetical protein
MVKELELKVWVYNLMLGLAAALLLALCSGRLTDRGRMYHEAGGLSWKLLKKQNSKERGDSLCGPNT